MLNDCWSLFKLQHTIVDIRENKRESSYWVEFADSDGCEFAIAYLRASEFMLVS